MSKEVIKKEKAEALKEQKEILKIILREKLAQVDNKTLHENWIHWYKRRKSITNSNTYLNMMLSGLVEDFYIVIEEKDRQIKELQEQLLQNKTTTDEK